MSAMTYREEYLAAAAGQKQSLEPAASDMLAKFRQAADRPFLRPGPEVLNEAIPVVFIGRNRDGLWVARDAEGKFGGLFWRKESVLRFAKTACAATGCATVFPQGRFELDIENAGNPLAARAGGARRLLIRQMRYFTYAIQKMRFGSRAGWPSANR
jgi:hypothetical protein